MKINGKCGISATVILDSFNQHSCTRMTTMELVYPRFIHQEILTHRMLSKNAASSRAIPVKTMIESIRKSPSSPVFWGENQAGMSAAKELEGLALERAKQLWGVAMEDALNRVEKLSFPSVNLHKQIANRISEPWQTMKVVVSGTEWANLLWLRNHKDAQPEFAELARCIAQVFEAHQPRVLKYGQWHVPYVTAYDLNGEYVYCDTDGNKISLEDALAISVSACAQVSYRKSDLTIEKAHDLLSKLRAGNRTHASPFEHQAMPMRSQFGDWDEGITHVDRNGAYWSGNLKCWIQHRQLIPNHVVW